MIPQETVRKILDAAQVDEVIGDFVSMRRRGADLWACCPFHNEKTPSFHIEPAKGRWYCFGCHKGGSAVGFVMEYEHLSYSDALRYLAKKYNIEVVEKEETAEDQALRMRSESLHLVSEYAAGFFRDQLSTAEGRSVGLAYFRSRGLEDSTIEKYGLGWAPSGRTTFTSAALAAGYKKEYLLETGLCAEVERDNSLRDRFYERVVFPIHSVSGRVIAFGARTLKAKEEGKPYAKYVNSKESEIYVKNQSLYGIWFAKNEIARKDKCYLVEGYLDVLSMHQIGIGNVVASSGTALTEGQIRLIRRFTDNVTIMYDGDSAGIHAALRGIDMFLKVGMNVKVVLIPDGDDPDSYSRKHSLEEVEAFLADSERDFVDFKASLLMDDSKNDPLKRANVINDIADTVALIPDAVKRTVYVDFLADKFGIRKDILESRVSSTRFKTMTEEKKAADREKERQERIAADHGSEMVGSLASDINPAQPAEAVTAPTGLDALEEDHLMGKSERELLNFILANGTSILEFQSDSDYFVESDEDKQTVFDFIAQALEDDGVSFVNSVYRKAFDEYSRLYYEGYEQETIVRSLMDGEDRNVAYVAAQLSTDEQYELSVKNLKDSLMSKGSWLTKYVPKAILVFQDCRLMSRERELMDELRNTTDEEGQNDILASLTDLRKTLRAVRIKLGRDKR